MSKPTLLLIDGFNLLSRAYFATSYNRSDDQLKNSRGVYTNALRVFFQKLFQLIRQHRITHLSILWDVTREETARRQRYPDYKATRSALPDPLLHQYETCRDIAASGGFHQLALPPHEADDLIGSLAKRWAPNPCYIYSNDRDLLQLLSASTAQIIAGKGGDRIYTADQFRADYGIEPEQWVDVKALLGDLGDNIPGCPGIGEKSALPLIRHYGSLERLYASLDQLEPLFARHRKKLVLGKESAFISQSLSRIEVDIPELADMPAEELALAVMPERLRDRFAEYELNIGIHLDIDRVGGGG